MAACAVATRCLSSSAMPPEAEGEGVEPPRSCDPAVFETAYRARGSPSVSGPDRSRTCTSPGKSRELSVELRSQDVVGRDRTCDAPRFRRALYRLSFDHVDGQGWTRTSSLLFVRQALYPLSYSPMSIEGGSRTLTGVAHGALDAARLPFRHLDPIPGQGIEPRSPRSERGVLPVRRSRIVPLRPAPGVGRSTQRHLGCQTALGTRAEPPMSMPLAYPSTLDRRSPFAHTAAVVVLRGGALEPDAQVRIGKSAC